MYAWMFTAVLICGASVRYANKLAQMTDEERASAESYCKRLPATPEYSAIARFFDQFVFIAPLFRMSEAQTAAGGKSYT